MLACTAVVGGPQCDYCFSCIRVKFEQRLNAEKPFLGNIYLMLSLLLKVNYTQLTVLMGGSELYYSQPPEGDRCFGV